jgi:gliding motility-associated-like protein
MRYFYLCLFILFALLPGRAAALPPNDDPCNPYFIGPLNPASACPFSAFTSPVVIGNQTTIGSTPEFPMPSLMSCIGGTGDMPASMSDVWYKFIPDGQSVQVLIYGQGNSPLQNPTIGLYLFTGSCYALQPVTCAKGSAGLLNVTFDGLVSGAEYLLQVGGASATETGDFTLFLGSSFNCVSCSQNVALLADPAPVNGYYNDNQLVNFYFVISGYKRNNNNSLHGVVPVFAPGWDMNTLQFISVQRTSTTPGTWIPYNYLNLPNLGNQQGWFFDDPSNDGNPTNNLGDAGGLTDNWIFHWQIRANACPSAVKNLNTTVHLFSDGMTGTGPQPGCPGDYPVHFSAVLNCCGGLATSVSPETCPGNCNGIAAVSFSTSASFLPTYNYNWFNGSGTNIQSLTLQTNTSDAISNACSDNYTFIATSAASPGCFIAQNIPVRTTFSLSDIHQTVFPCFNNGQATATVYVEPPGTYSYSWSNGNTNATATNLIAGNTYTVYVSNGNCVETDTINVKASPPNDPSFQYPSQFLSKCQGGQLFIDPLYVATPGGTFFCSAPGVVNPGSGTINIANTTVNTSYTIVYTTPSPCPKSDSVLITIVPQDTAYFTYPAYVYCNTETYTVFPDTVAAYGGYFSVLNLSGPSNGFPVDSVSGIAVPPFFAGTYVVTYTSANQGPCQSTWSDTVVIKAVPSLTGQTNYTFCPGDNSLVLTLNTASPCPSCQVIWDDDPNFGSPNNYVSNFTINPSTDPLTYYVIAYDLFPPNCFSIPIVVNVTPSVPPSVSITSSDSVVCPGFSGTLHAGSTGLNYSWVPPSPLDNPSSPDPGFTLNSTTTFTVYVTDPSSSCTTPAQFTVVVDSTRNCDSLIIYSGFSPNNDNINDVWIIDGISKFPKNHVTIFNRWGERVWQADDYDNRKVVWDGKSDKGKDLPVGTYFYVVQFEGGVDKPARRDWVELTR